MLKKNLTLEEKIQLDLLSQRYNHIAVGSGIVGLLVCSIVDYFLSPSLWFDFLIIRFIISIPSIIALFINWFLKKGSQILFYSFWLVVSMFTSYAVSQQSSLNALLAWNLQLALGLIFIATIALTYFPLIIILVVPTIISYILFNLLFSSFPFVQILVNGGAIYLIGNLIVPLIVLTRFKIISENIRLNLQNKNQADQLLALNKVKDRFFEIIAHDLRGPIRLALRQVEMLVQGESREPQEDLNLLKASIAQVNNLLENLLLWARSQKEGLKAELEAVNLNQVINEVIQNIQNLVQKKGLSLEMELSETISVYADSEMLKTILRNVLSNAIKYSFRKSLIKIKTQSIDSRVILSVEDQGTGIDSKRILDIFSIESKQSMPGTDGEVGSGLGLIISREFANAIQAKLWLESSAGKGTTVYLELPKAN